MNQQPDEFEAELARLQPRKLSRSVADRIAGELDQPARMSIADRCLVGFMGAGALAASVIVGLVSWQIIEDRAPRVPPPGPTIAQYPSASMGEYQQALARSNGPSFELFR
jgi:hypothetical protein